MNSQRISTHARFAALALMIAGAQQAFAMPHREAMPDISCHFDYVQQKQQPAPQADFRTVAYSEAVSAWLSGNDVATRRELSCTIDDDANAVSSPTGHDAPGSGLQPSA